MFERVFNRLGHGSVVEKIEEEAESGEGQRIVVVVVVGGYFFFNEDKKQRFVWRMGDVREVGRIEIEGNGEDRN